MASKVGFFYYVQGLAGSLILFQLKLVNRFQGTIPPLFKYKKKGVPEETPFDYSYQHNEHGKT